MVAPGDRIGVAVSGGADSLALLLALQELAPTLGLQLAVLHLDHAWRPESADDATFVAQWAARLGLPLMARRAEELRQARGNREQAARQARYVFFRECLASGEINCVATAHTADDQTETVLLRLLRGAGTRGLAGIWPVVRAGPNEKIIRPALACRREQLRAWLRAKNEPWQEDASNWDLGRRRNRIRHELLPVLTRDYNPALVERLADLAALARAEEEYWTAEVAARVDRLWRATSAGWEADTRELAALPLALARRVLRAGLAAARGDLRRVEFQQVEQVLDLIRAVGLARAQSSLAGRPPSGSKHLHFGGLTLRISPKSTIILRFGA